MCCKVEAKVTKTQGVRIFVEGKILDGTKVVAQGEFVLADIAELNKGKK